MRQTFRIGTRGSALALWQTNHVADLLRAAWPSLSIEIEVFTTRGDVILDTPLPQVGGKGLFTAELEEALYNKQIDFAVHSLKDLPTDQPDRLALGAIPVRENPADVLVSRGSHTLDTLPTGASVGTSSLRRAAQILSVRPDVKTLDIRGNVDTRVRKALDLEGSYDAIVLAYAGLNRLGTLSTLGDHAHALPLDQMLPAPGQGALGIQCRNERESLEVLAPIAHLPTTYAVSAERGFLAGLGGGCSVPVSAYASLTAGQLMLRGRVSAVDGANRIEVSGVFENIDSVEAARAAGEKLAEEARVLGAESILEGTR